MRTVLEMPFVARRPGVCPFRSGVWRVAGEQQFSPSGAGKVDAIRLAEVHGLAWAQIGVVEAAEEGRQLRLASLNRGQQCPDLFRARHDAPVHLVGDLRWHGNRLLAAYDWDSFVADSEPVIAGLAAAIYPALATVIETRDFLDAYVAARGRTFSPGELQLCWAAGVWTRAFDAKKQYAAGQPVISLTEDEARERLHQAGLC